MSSSTDSTLKFTPHPNGDTDVFPGHARTIALFDGFPDLLHLRKHSEADDQNPQYGLVTFKNGRQTTIFDMKSPDNGGWGYWSDGKTLCVWGESPTVIFISQKNRSFKAEKVTAPKGLRTFMRTNGTNYFVSGSWSTEFKLFSSANDGILLRWRRPDCNAQLLRMVGSEFVLCHMFDEKTLVRTHQLQDGVFTDKHDVSVPFPSYESANLGDHHFVLIGSDRLAVVDCRNGDVTMWTFANKLAGKIRECAARVDGNSATVFVSTQSNDGDRTARVHCAKFPFHEKDEPKGKGSDNELEDLRKQVAILTISNKEMKRELEDVRSDNEAIHDKLSKLEKVMAKLIMRSSSAGSSLSQIVNSCISMTPIPLQHDSDSIRSSDSCEQEPATEDECWPAIPL